MSAEPGSPAHHLLPRHRRPLPVTVMLTEPTDATGGGRGPAGRLGNDGQRYRAPGLAGRTEPTYRADRGTLLTKTAHKTSLRSASLPA